MMRGIVAAISTCALFMSSVSHAQSVGAEMNSFFSDMGAAANATGPSAYQGQAAGYYTMGNIWTRFPEKNVSPINIQLPGARAGCGGIDIFGGSFSFINAAEFIALLKATANNALGFAFKLAIDSISPEIGNVMGELQDKVQQLNQMNISSCETAQNLVGSLWPKTDIAARQICSTIGTQGGLFSDWARARQGCGNEGKTNSTIAANADPNLKDMPGMPQNFTWEALKKSHSGMSREFREFLMTLVGTTIIDTKGGNFRPISAASSPVYLEMLDGKNYSAKLWKCDEEDKCMNPVLSDLTISPSDAIKPKVRALIKSMSDKARNPNAVLSTDEMGLLGATSVPLYKIILVNNAINFGLSEAELDHLAEIVASDFLNTMVNRFLEIASKSQGAFNGTDGDSLANWRQQIEKAREQFGALRITNNDKLKATMDIIDRTAFFEKSLRTQMSPQLSGAMRFSKGMSNQGLR